MAGRRNYLNKLRKQICTNCHKTEILTIYVTKTAVCDPCKIKLQMTAKKESGQERINSFKRIE